jgi:hypothetical protein
VVALKACDTATVETTDTLCARGALSAWLAIEGLVMASGEMETPGRPRKKATARA